MDEREQLELAITAQEGLRGVVGDDVVDATVGALQARLDALAGAASGGQRRKQVTVLFADVSGFTTTSESMDAEDLAESINALWHRLDGAITNFNGRVDKHIGDAVMGLWGTDEAREDDPEQAIRAALAMHEALDELAASGAPQSTRLRIRVGINTGPVVLGQVGTTGEFTAMGDTVNVAARLESAAPVGGILIHHDTYRHVRGLFSIDVQPPLAVKGKAAPLTTYVVNGVRPRAFRLQSRGVEGVETRMIGRRAELERLRDALDGSIKSPALQLVEIVGDAGIGKSRLLYEFEDWLRVQPAEVRLFKGRADRQHQGVPYALARDIFLFRFEIADNDPPDVALAKLEAGVAGFMGTGAREQAHLIGHLIGLDLSDSDTIGGIIDDAKQLHDRALRAITQLFVAVTDESPAVLLLEDIHWADQASLQLVLHLAATCSETPFLIVALTRPSLFERIPGWSDGVAGLIRVELTRLSDEESGHLIDEVLQKVPHIPDLIRNRIVENVDGNPFYVEELIKMMIEDGVIIISDEVWHMEAARLTDLQVPATLTGVLQARLDRLPSRERDTLERASAVGRIFWDGAIPPLGRDGLEPAASQLAHDLPETLEALQSKELIGPNDTPDFAGTNEFIFQHAILHEVTYEGVLKSLRRTYHGWIAQWLAGRAEVSAHPAMIAHHYELAELPVEAARWYALAGQQAQARYANDDAVGYYQLALLPDTLEAAERVALNRGLGEVLTLLARYDEALDATETMLDQARNAGDVTGQARALYAMSTAHTRLGRNRDALQTAEEAEQLLTQGRLAPPVELADVLTRVGWAHLRLGQIEPARIQAEKALAQARQTDHAQVLRRVQNLSGAIHAALGEFEEAADFFESALVVNRELGDRIGEGRALLNLGEIARLRGDFARAESMSRQALTIQQELGDRDQLALTMSNIGAAHVGSGNYREAIAQLQEAGGEFTAAGASEHISETHRLLAEAHLGVDESQQALDQAKEALSHAEADENPEHVGHAWRVLGMVADRLDAPIDVVWRQEPKQCDSVACFRTSVAIFTEARMEADRALALQDWASAEMARGDLAHGEALWREARQLFDGLGLSLFVARMDAKHQLVE